MSMFRTLKGIKRCMLPSHDDLGDCGKYAVIGKPVYITHARSLHMEDYSVLRKDARILNNVDEHVYIKKYTVISVNCTIVTNNHRSTVGIPQCLLGASHINDKSQDITIEEDVWVGANVTILSGARLGRGCIAGACCTISKPVPPYALVVGAPAKIVGVKFNIDQIIEHEKMLYPENERFSREYLENLFETYYKDKRVFGVSTEFTQGHLDAINNALELRGFDMPEYMERFRHLVKE